MANIDDAFKSISDAFWLKWTPHRADHNVKGDLASLLDIF